MLDTFKTIIGVEGNEEDKLLNILLKQSETAVLRRLYPYNHSKKNVPERYEPKVIQIAIYLYNKRGAEGQLYHHEGSVMRGYESGHIPESMLIDIVPMVGVPK